MVTEEEIEMIVQKAAERILLALPEVVGNLITNHVTLHKINTEFYKTHKEFADRKDVVQSVVEMMEGDNPLLPYEQLLEKAVPEIRKRLEIVKAVDITTSPRRVDRDFKAIDLTGNGEV